MNIVDVECQYHTFPLWLIEIILARCGVGVYVEICHLLELTYSICQPTNDITPQTDFPTEPVCIPRADGMSHYHHVTTHAL